MTQATPSDWKPDLDWAYHLFKTNAVLSSLTITSLVRDCLSSSAKDHVQWWLDANDILSIANG
jgi:hypothetical protein